MGLAKRSLKAQLCMPELKIDVERWRMQQRGESPSVIGEAVLRNYPLRLWLRQRDHMATVVTEFERVRAGKGPEEGSVPQQLLDLAEMFSTVFGALINGVYDERRKALDAGLDRMDSRVPLVKRTPDYLDHFQMVLRAVDDCCEDGQLDAPCRPPLVAALMDWTLAELTAQYYGAQPTPWAGPF